MNRQVVAGILGLALAGCAQDRSALKNQSSRLGSVELTPAMPSIHEAINLSTESLEVPQQPIENAQVVETPPSPPAGPAMVQQPTPPDIDQGVERTSATQPELSAPPAIAVSPASGPVVAESPMNMEPVTNPASTTENLATRPLDVQAAVVANPVTPAQSAKPERDPLLGANPDIMPIMELPADRPGTQAANVAPASLSSAAPVSPAQVPAEPSPTVNPIAPSPTVEGDLPQAPATIVEPDPLLGDHPEIMPSLDLPSASVAPQAAPVQEQEKPMPSPATSPAQPEEQAKAAPPAPTVEAASQPAPAPPTPQPTPAAAPRLAPAAMTPQPAPAAAVPLEKQKTPTPATTTSKPAEPASDPAAPAPLPINPEEFLNQPIELPPLSDSEDDKTSALMRANGTATDILREPGTVLTSSMFVEPKGEKDSASKPTTEKPKAGDDAAALRSKIPPRSVFEAGKAMARVGEEVITLRELKYAVKQRRAMIPPGQQLTSEESYMLAKGVLGDLVDRALVLQEAKREIKNPKQLKMFMDMADKIWQDEELPPLLRKHSVANIYELKEKLIQNNDSIEELREAYRQDFLFRGYIDQKLGPKMKVELPEMIDYYNEHLHDFDQVAQTTWREVVIETSLHPNRADAKKKADAALARLRRGDDFAKVAAEMSEGPNKAKGGLWKTAPGSYSVASVNALLESLPTGQISQVVEGPTGFHIVRVEARRPAGPSTFAEVQDDIRRTLRGQKVREQSSAYLEKLRKKTPVSTVFDTIDGVQQTSADVEESPRKTAAK